MKNDFEIRGEITAIILRRRDGTLLETLISTSDLEKANSFPGIWHASEDKKTNNFYVIGRAKKAKTIVLARLLLNAPKGTYVDHINHDTLNNTRDNLRITTCSQNQQNRKGATTRSKSGIRGVHRFRNGWQAQIRINKKLLFIGSFKDIKEAEKAVIEARKKYMPYSLDALEAQK